MPENTDITPERRALLEHVYTLRDLLTAADGGQEDGLDMRAAAQILIMAPDVKAYYEKAREQAVAVVLESITSTINQVADELEAELQSAEATR